MIAVIPARSGSKGVKDKNIKTLEGIPLIAHSINSAKLIKNVERIIVSTDSYEYAEIARSFDAETPFIRPKEFSSDLSTDLDVFKHLKSWLKEKENFTPKYFIHLRPTSPIRNEKILNKAVENFIENKKIATSLRSAHLAPESPFKWFMKDSKGFFKGLRKNIDSNKVNLPRQSFPDVFVPNGYIDIIKSENINRYNSLHGEKMLVYETPICYEIDTIHDFHFVEYIIKNIK